jgi:hypothetical protein
MNDTNSSSSKKERIMIRVGEPICDLAYRSATILDKLAKGTSDTFEILDRTNNHEIVFSFLDRDQRERAINLGIAWFLILRGSAAHVTSLTFSHQSTSSRWQDFLNLSKDSIAAINSTKLHRIPLAGNQSMPIEEMELLTTAARPLPATGDKIAMAAWLTPNHERIILYARHLGEFWHLETLVCIDHERELRLKNGERRVREYFGYDPENRMRLNGTIEAKNYVDALEV